MSANLKDRLPADLIKKLFKEVKGNDGKIKMDINNRSKVKKTFVRWDNNIGELRAELPVGIGWNRDGSDLEWINLGWTPAEQWDAEVNAYQAEQKREVAKAEMALAALAAVATDAPEEKPVAKGKK